MERSNQSWEKKAKILTDLEKQKLESTAREILNDDKLTSVDGEYKLPISNYLAIIWLFIYYYILL